MSDDEEFQYIIERQEQAKVCFLSGKERGLDVLKKSSMMSKPLNLGMTSALHKTLNKIRSTRGVGGLADLGPRFEKMRLEQIPGPTKYSFVVRKPIKPNIRSFGCAPRILTILSNTPGPGTYEQPIRCRRINMCHKFGGRVRMRMAFQAECVRKALDKCEKCHVTCVGDYWQIRHTNFLCLKCYRVERINKKTKFSINGYRRMRNCSYMHRHDGATAAIRIMTNKEIFTKAGIENYLDLFFNKF